MTDRYREFVRAVAYMRDLQRAFFAGNREVMGRAKAAEREVDRLLRRLAQVDSEPSLFDSVDDGLCDSCGVRHARCWGRCCDVCRPIKEEED